MKIQKSLFHTKVNLGLDIAIILLNILTPFIIIIWDICNNKIIPNRRRRFIAREKNFNSVKKKTDGISKEPSKEESSNDDITPGQERKINKPVEKKKTNPNPTNDLGVPPAAGQGASPESS